MMQAAAFVDHLFGVPHLLAGLAMVRWHTRIGNAMLKSQEAFTEALNMKAITWWHRQNRRIFGPRFASGMVLVIGVVFTIVGGVLVVAGAQN